MLENGSFCSCSRYLSRLMKVSKKIGVREHALRSCRRMRPFSFGSTMSSIYTTTTAESPTRLTQPSILCVVCSTIPQAQLVFWTGITVSHCSCQHFTFCSSELLSWHVNILWESCDVDRCIRYKRVVHMDSWNSLQTWFIKVTSLHDKHAQSLLMCRTQNS